MGQYPKFLRQHWKFLKTVVNKLFEFMHETHPGVQVRLQGQGREGEALSVGEPGACTLWWDCTLALPACKQTEKAHLDAAAQHTHEPTFPFTHLSKAWMLHLGDLGERAKLTQVMCVVVALQDMACDTFLKISNKCKRKFVVLQLQEQQPFVGELLDNLTDTIQDLQPHQIQSFYESVGLMISAEGESGARTGRGACRRVFLGSAHCSRRAVC